MGRRPKKRLCERLEYDLTWAALDEKKQDDLIRLSQQGKHISLIDDEPELPFDVTNIYSAFMELRNSTAGDQPVRFVDKVAAWEVYGDVGFEMFARFISALDSTFLKKQNESHDKRRLEGSKRRKAEATAKKLKAESKQIGSKPTGRK